MYYNLLVSEIKDEKPDVDDLNLLDDFTDSERPKAFNTIFLDESSTPFLIEDDSESNIDDYPGIKYRIKSVMSLEKSGYCSECLLDFEQIHLHLNIYHRNKPEYWCETCGQLFSKLNKYNKHVLKHSELNNADKIECYVCLSSTFDDFNQLFHHLEKHRCLHVHPCMKCSKTFAFRKNFKEHMLLKHGEEDTSNALPVQPTLEVNDTRTDESTTVEDPLSMISVENSENATVANNSSGTVDEENTEGHCYDCDKTFSLIKAHKAIFHQGGTEIFCEICGRLFWHNEALIKHRSKHRKHRIKCHVCNEKIFEDSISFLKHLDSHSELHVYYCRICSKSYGLSKHYEKHLRKKHPNMNSSQNKDSASSSLFTSIRGTNNNKVAEITNKNIMSDISEEKTGISTFGENSINGNIIEKLNSSESKKEKRKKLKSHSTIHVENELNLKNNDNVVNTSMSPKIKNKSKTEFNSVINVTDSNDFFVVEKSKNNFKRKKKDSNSQKDKSFSDIDEEISIKSPKKLKGNFNESMNIDRSIGENITVNDKKILKGKLEKQNKDSLQETPSKYKKNNSQGISEFMTDLKGVQLHEDVISPSKRKQLLVTSKNLDYLETDNDESEKESLIKSNSKCESQDSNKSFKQNLSNNDNINPTSESVDDLIILDDGQTNYEKSKLGDKLRSKHSTGLSRNDDCFVNNDKKRKRTSSEIVEDVTETKKTLSDNDGEKLNLKNTIQDEKDSQSLNNEIDQNESISEFDSTKSDDYYLLNLSDTVDSMVDSTCFVCDKHYPDSSKLYEHFFQKHNSNSKSCLICHKKFCRNETLYFHTMKHKRKYPWGCKICGTKFKVKYLFKKHMTSVHHRERNYKCNVCNKRFIFRTTLVAHERTHGNDMKFTCAHCSKTFVYKLHLLPHLKKRSCKLCGVKFMCKTKYDHHFETCHCYEKVFDCKECDRSFKLEHLLKRHVTIKHFDLKVSSIFYCKLCDYMINTKHNLARHVRKKHKNHKVPNQNS